MMDYVIGFGIGVVSVVMVYEVCASVRQAKNRARRRRDMDLPPDIR